MNIKSSDKKLLNGKQKHDSTMWSHLYRRNKLLVNVELELLISVYKSKFLYMHWIDRSFYRKFCGCTFSDPYDIRV